ncbi:MAG: DUF1059 domain-containing protein [Nitrosopumilus sp.]|nr:DUF1059 domain-containing protein [Nitrosopumilus sp.]
MPYRPLGLGDKIAGKLACQNYGISCSFMTTEDAAEKIVTEFKEHLLDEHFIDYPEGMLRKSIEEKQV